MIACALRASAAEGTKKINELFLGIAMKIYLNLRPVK
jgi:hypothetical protein